MTPTEFINLKRQLKTGNGEQLKSIFESTASYCINKLILKHKCGQEDAEDIYTDAILNLRDKIINDKIDSLVDLRGYLYATCKNMLLVKLKRAKRFNNSLENFYNGHTVNILQDDDVSYKDGIIKLAMDALSTLPVKCRELLKAFYFDQLSMEEMADKFKFSSANVAKVSKSRCLQKLVEQIKNMQKENKVNNANK